MEVKIFRVEGEVRKKGKQPLVFKKELRALNEKDALEEIYSKFGGLYKVKRTRIIIKSIKEISPEEVTDPMVKALL
ncbi:50S ribosomal protein L18Ae [Methanocaldococcus indicus]|uniref:50S ribosomal protein L18Ae n=1 Tax=Methanocaldococcus indicus TaxID=213231 RepID=UPI003C6D6E5C